MMCKDKIIAEVWRRQDVCSWYRATAFAYLISAFSALAVMGCRPLDLTRGHVGPTPMCPIHACGMHRERMSVAGEIVYLGDYRKEVGEHFPNHGCHTYSLEADDTPYARDIIDWVCPECHRAYLEYWRHRSAER